MQKSPQVIAVFVAWKSEKDIIGCLESAYGQTYINLRIVVIDNGSPDNTSELVKTKFPQAELLETQKNTYYTGGLNFGIRHVQKNYPEAKYILVANTDIKMHKDMVMHLVKRIETDTQIGAVGPKVLFYNKPETIYSMGIFYDGFRIATQINHLEKDSSKFDEPEQVFGIEGTCILFRADIFKDVGLFWEKLQMYSEDVEFFIRANRNGWKSVVEPKALLYHKVMASTSQNKSMDIEALKQRNWLFIALRHYKLTSKLAMLKQYIFYKLGIRQSDK